jgi:carbamoyltransferase
LTYILGLNINHADTAACLFKNNELLSAVEEERFTRVKHYSLFPFNSIKFCLSKANINISQLDYITINSNPFSSISKKIIFTFLNPKSLNIVLPSLDKVKKNFSINKFLKLLNNDFNYNGQIKYYDHHLSHMASSCNFSPFKNAVNLSVDGFGDFSSCGWGLSKNYQFKVEGRIFFPHSLGIFYQAMTQYLGFKNYGDEYKVMGLSSYGKPEYVDLISNLITNKKNLNFELNLNYFLHHKKKIFNVNPNGSPIFSDLYSNNLIKLLGPERKMGDIITERHKNIAKSTQEVFEKILFNFLNDLYQKYQIENLNLSGGCAMNSVANGKIIFNTKFKNIYTSSNPGDAGGAIGSALCFLNQIEKNNRKSRNLFFDPLPYLGDAFKNEEISIIIKNYKLDKKFNIFKIDEDNKLSEYISNLISKSYVIGWFQDKMEWGPRALGNRSILSDPRNPKMKEILNFKIKKRENFRPFAPAILKDFVGQWFEINKSVPYMSEVYKIKENKRSLIPAVTHIDGTGRLQSVSKNQNYKFYKLIEKFYKITGVPVILNTSFNENEPIVRTPQEAIECYLRTKMDILVLQNWIIERKNSQ